MQKRSLLLLATIIAWGCQNKPEVGEIESKTPSPWKPGTQIILKIPIRTTKQVTYSWRSADGGSFDDASAPAPKFTLPQKAEVRILCDLSVDGTPYPINPFVARVDSAETAPISGPVEPVAPNPATMVVSGVGDFDIEKNGFIPGGWMGDGMRGRQFIQPQFKSPDELNVHPNAQKWIYRTGGELGWAAVAWQYPANNWGSKPGLNLEARHFSQVAVWARGLPDSRGAMPKLTFKSGGGTDASKPYQDSFAVEMPNAVQLTKQWREYTLDLQGKNVRSVVTGFIFAIDSSDNPNGATFYLADIRFR